MYEKELGSNNRLKIENDRLLKEIQQHDRSLEKFEQTIGELRSHKHEADLRIEQLLSENEELKSSLEIYQQKLQEKTKAAQLLEREADDRERKLKRTESISKVKMDAQITPLGITIKNTRFLKMGRSKSMLPEELHGFVGERQLIIEELDSGQAPILESEERKSEGGIPEEDPKDGSASERSSHGSVVINENATAPSIFCNFSSSEKKNLKICYNR